MAQTLVLESHADARLNGCSPPGRAGAHCGWLDPLSLFCGFYFLVSLQIRGEMGFFWPFMNIKLQSGNVGKITHDCHGPVSVLPHSSIFNYFKDRFANIFIPSFYGVSGENESLLVVSFFFFSPCTGGGDLLLNAGRALVLQGHSTPWSWTGLCCLLHFLLNGFFSPQGCH